MKKSENPKNPNPTGNALSIQTAIICPNSLVQKTLQSSWNIGYSEKSHKKERLEDPGSRPMVGDPTTALLLDMVFCATGVGMTMKVKAPVKIIWSWWVTSNEQNDIEAVDLKV